MTLTLGLSRLKHLVVLMMENRSFDHMLGGLSFVMENGQQEYPGVNGLQADFRRFLCCISWGGNEGLTQSQTGTRHF